MMHTRLLLSCAGVSKPASRTHLWLHVPEHFVGKPDAQLHAQLQPNSKKREGSAAV